MSVDLRGIADPKEIHVDNHSSIGGVLDGEDLPEVRCGSRDEDMLPVSKMTSSHHDLTAGTSKLASEVTSELCERQF